MSTAIVSPVARVSYFPYRTSIYGRQTLTLRVLSVVVFMQQVLPTLNQITEINPKDRVLEFTQQAGDIVLLPDNWGHATLNIESSIGAVFIFEYCDGSL